MIKALRYSIYTLWAVAVSFSCTQQRDLHVDSKPMFIIKNDWSATSLNPESATAMLYSRPDPCEPMYNNANRHKLYLASDIYDILVFNEAMLSPNNTGHDGIVYRKTESLETFGAYAIPSPVNPIFRTDPGEVMVGYNYPSILATEKFTEKEVLTEKQYVMKYQDGNNKFPETSDFDADSVELVPIHVTREVQVIAHVKNLANKYRVSATLRGFAEGVLLATRTPDGSNAAYTFDLNSAVQDPKVENGYIIVSQPFRTFGPWWNDYPSGRRYVVDFVSTKGGGVVLNSFDVTESNRTTVTQSVGDAIKVIREEEAKYLEDGTPPPMNPIIIEVWFELPIADDSIDVGMGDWGTDIIIPIPMGF